LRHSNIINQPIVFYQPLRLLQLLIGWETEAVTISVSAPDHSQQSKVSCYLRKLKTCLITDSDLESDSR